MPCWQLGRRYRRADKEASLQPDQGRRLANFPGPQDRTAATTSPAVLPNNPNYQQAVINQTGVMGVSCHNFCSVRGVTPQPCFALGLPPGAEVVTDAPWLSLVA